MRFPIFHIIVILTAAYLTPLNLATAQASTTTEFNPTFTHVVYFWFKNPDDAAARKTFEQAAKKFMQESQYAKTRFIGVAPQATREVVDDSFTYSLILTFDSAEAQAKYQAEPAHDAFVATCKELWEKVIVYDSTPLPSQ